MTQAVKTPSSSVAVGRVVTTPTELPLEYFAAHGKWMFREANHLFDESDLASVKRQALSNGDAAIGGVNVHVTSDLPAFAAQKPALVLDALATTSAIAKSLFPNPSVAWEQDDCDAERVVFVVTYNVGDTMDDDTLYEKHQQLLRRFHDELPEEARAGVSLERVIN